MVFLELELKLLLPWSFFPLLKFKFDCSLFHPFLFSLRTQLLLSPSPSFLSLNSAQAIATLVSIPSFFNYHLVLLFHVLELYLICCCLGLSPSSPWTWAQLLPWSFLLSPLLEFNSNYCRFSFSPLVELEFKLPWSFSLFPFLELKLNAALIHIFLFSFPRVA